MHRWPDHVTADLTFQPALELRLCSAWCQQLTFGYHTCSPANSRLNKPYTPPSVQPTAVARGYEACQEVQVWQLRSTVGAKLSVERTFDLHIEALEQALAYSIKN